MKRMGWIALAVLLALPAAGQVDKKLEKEMKASYAKVIGGIKKKDIKAIMDQLTPDATMTEMGQTMNRAQTEAMMKQQMPMMDLQSADIKFSKLAAKGDTAAGEYTETMKAKVKGPKGKTSVMESVAKYKATFKKMGGQWKLRTSETIGTPNVKIDGKAVRAGSVAK